MVYGVRDIARNMLGLRSRSETLRKGEFWALQGLSFEVQKGETVGVIGPNGSGKSTLLKLINGIFMPDRGIIEISGRVGALIEVGAGFHPMLSGRENVYVNGAILGMSKKEIDEKFDAIVDFADIWEFIDAPVKHYSSGMYVRLGFSIAVHAEPDILIIDEVLAVGDINFQIKCFRKIAEFKEQEKTIIIVTHDMTAIQRHAERVLLLNKGEIIADDVPQKIVSKYLALVTNEKADNLEKSGKEQLAAEDDSAGNQGSAIQRVFYQENPAEDLCRQREGYNRGEFRYGNGGVRITDYELQDPDGRKIPPFKSGEALVLRIKVKFLSNVQLPIFGIKITTGKGVEIFNNNTLLDKDLKVKPQKKGDTLWVEYTVNLDLSPGEYFLSAGVATINAGEVIALDRRYDLVLLSVSEGDDDVKKADVQNSINICYGKENRLL